MKNAIPIQFAGPEPLDSTFEFPEEEADQDMRSGMQMLAYGVAISMAVCVVLGVLYAVYR